VQQQVAMQTDDNDSIADSAFSMNSGQGGNPVTNFFGNMFGRRSARPGSANARPQQQQQNFQGPFGAPNVNRVHRVPPPQGFRGFQRRASDSEGGDSTLLRIAVAKAMASLEADKRHMLLEQLKEDASFACLFTYTPGPSAEASALAAQRTRVTSDHTTKLAAAVSRAKDTALPPPAAPAAAVNHAAGPAPMEVDSGAGATAAAGAAAGAASAPNVTIACMPEFEQYALDAPAAAAAASTAPRVRLVVSLKAASEVAKQGQVALTSVLDVSGSMSGKRIELLKETSHFLVQQVTASDFLGFVSYSDNTCHDVPLCRMTPTGKAFAHTIIEALEANGSTALYDGTISGMKQQREAVREDARLAKAVLLCTDGEANIGPQDADAILPGLRRECQEAGQPCTVHTFGIGDGHCASLLQAIAEAMSGSYYYIKKSDDVAPAYGDALGGLLSVVAKNVRVTVRGVNGAEVLAVNAGGVVEGNNRVVFNDLYAEETRELLLQLSLPALPAPAAGADGASTSAGDGGASKGLHGQKLAEVEVQYTDPASGTTMCHVVPVSIVRTASPVQTPHPVVVSTAARYETADVIEKAQQLNEAGKLSDAKQLLEAHATKMSASKSVVGPEAKAQFDVYSSQAQVVAKAMQEAEDNKHDAAQYQMQSAVCKAASVGLRAQRAANVGMTSFLPQTAMYDNRTKAATRDKAAKSVAASMMAKSAPKPRNNNP